MFICEMTENCGSAGAPGQHIKSIKISPDCRCLTLGGYIHSLMGELIPCDMHLQVFRNCSTILILKGSPQLGVFHNTLHSWWQAHSASLPAHKDLMVSPLGVQDLGNHKRCGAIAEMFHKPQTPSFSFGKKGTLCSWVADSSKEYGKTLLGNFTSLLSKLFWLFSTFFIYIAREEIFKFLAFCQSRSL